MKHAAVLRLIQRALRQRRVRYTGHAADAMEDDGETRESVEAALRSIRSISPQDNGRWRVRAEGLVAILEVEEDRILVVTIYAG